MDGIYRYQRHIYDATRKYYLIGRDRLIRELNVPDGGSVLEVGCGTGRNLRMIRRLYPHAHLYGLDISQEMLVSARGKFAKTYGRQPVLRVADATTFTPDEFGVTGFDRVVISYALSMIPDWEGAIAQALAALNPGGQLHIVDFGQQERLPGPFRSLLHRWLSRFHVTPRSLMRAVAERLAEPHGAKLEFRVIGAGYAWHLVLAVPAREK
ncbi:methyltransferase [Sinorhizobium sp. BG8]|uniref:class I SAM-dependent methyltransferase n=1 Tax=Sinorhizobium sp. BG8 TaxID=2613773 RepID=UPI00193D3465|nr:methyltransferase [Sinorhizobium sp. BG8]QRM56974.1 methyltransferase [Sinorhizobium sp. BG8]